MLTVPIDLAMHDELVRVAARTGRSEAELAAEWIKHGLQVAEMHHRIDNFHTLSDEQRRELANWAGDFATGAQLLALDAEDGGYDWGRSGPPGDAR
jgi:hypothetical protein